MWVSLAAAVVLGAAMALSFARPSWAGGGGVLVGVTTGRLEIARSDGDLSRQGIAWAVNCPEGMASILIGPESWWRPTGSAARVTLGTTAISLRVTYVPLWPLLVLGLGAGGACWWRAGKRVKPGHCAACGYDLGGLSSGRCPECGAGREFAAARALRVVADWLRRPVVASTLCVPRLCDESPLR
jgi:hypothetical protein